MLSLPAVLDRYANTCDNRSPDDSLALLVVGPSDVVKGDCRSPAV